MEVLQLVAEGKVRHGGIDGALIAFAKAGQDILFLGNSLAEEIHHNHYSEALKAVEAGSDLPARKIYVCPVCGNTVYGEAPDKCPICNVPAEKFVEVA